MKSSVGPPLVAVVRRRARRRADWPSPATVDRAVGGLGDGGDRLRAAVDVGVVGEHVDRVRARVLGDGGGVVDGDRWDIPGPVDRDLAQGRRQVRVSRAEHRAVLHVAGVPRDVAAAGRDRGEGAPAPVRGGVSPVRTLIATPVPRGVAASQVSAPQLALWPGPASKTRDSKVPEAGYGLIRIQSTESRDGAVGEVAGDRAQGGAEGPAVGGRPGSCAVDEEADLGRVPFDPIEVGRPDELTRERRCSRCRRSWCGPGAGWCSGWC